MGLCFTVGALPAIVHQVRPDAVFAACKTTAQQQTELSADKISLRSYLNDYSDGAIKRISLSEIHKKVNGEYLFGEERLNDLQQKVDGMIAYTDIIYNDEKVRQMLRAASLTEALEMPQSHYEVDMRHMLRCCVHLDENGEDVSETEDQAELNGRILDVVEYNDATHNFDGEDQAHIDEDNQQDELQYVPRVALFNSSPL